MNDAARFGHALSALEAGLDWDALGRLYCWDGGEAFFPPEQVEAVREAGIVIASALGEELARLGSGGTSHSLYVGPGVAELVPILCEHLVLGREVTAINLDNAETRELNRALEATERETGIGLPRIGIGRIEEQPGRFDHGWMVSVINDPEAFPALHDELYGREGQLATGQGDLADDRRRADELAATLLDRLAPVALLTTTDEELPQIEPLARERGWNLEPSPDGWLTAVVGDPLRFVRMRRRA